MLNDAVESFLSSVTEREFDAPLIALLRAHGFSKIHLLHGQFEFGKDVIAQRDETGKQYVFQSKAGDIGLSEWMRLRGQLDVLRTNELAHPDFDASLPREAVLVLTGRLIGGARLEAQDYARQVSERGEPSFVVWERERLMELLSASPHVGLTGFSDGPLLELLGRVDQGLITESGIERFSERWVGGTMGIRWSSMLEASLIANKLRASSRLDLACFTTLGVLRALWASVHGSDPAMEVWQQRAAIIGMFKVYASELEASLPENALDPKSLIQDDVGVIATYPVQCLRVIEILAMYALAAPTERERIAEFLVKFVASQPGAAHPISDRWSVSLIPTALVIGPLAPQACREWLTAVVRWLGDRHDNDGRGMAGPHAEPLEEIEYLLGSSLEHVGHLTRRHSYLGAVLLDLASVLEDRELYDLAYNDITALDIRPFFAVPRDDSSQYFVTGHGIDVPVNTSPKYSEYWADGDGWRMAAHHDEDSARYYLGRLGAQWDHLAISLVTRDRHWVAGMRSLLE